MEVQWHLVVHLGVHLEVVVMRLRALSRVGAHLMPLVLGAGVLEGEGVVEGPFSFAFLKQFIIWGVT